MEENNYINYTATDLLNDEDFLASEQWPTEESKLFWAKLEAEYPPLACEINSARSLLRVVASSSGKRLSPQAAQQLWNNIEKCTIAKPQRIAHHFLRQMVAAAACIALLMAGGWMAFMYVGEEDYSEITSVKRPDAQPTEDIQLVLSDTKKITISGQESKLHYKNGKVDVNSQAVKIEKHEDATATEVYNQLIVPAGKRSSITFQDGTRVVVNANTRVVYPVEFAANRREIYVEGEIYLEVSPDKKRPFIVKTSRMDVRVLGTKFNVNAYTESQAIVLVSGKVEVDTHRHGSQLLKPNEMLAYTGDQLKVQTVNVHNYISWIEGYYVFNKEKISAVAIKLSHYYEKKIVVSPALQGITCSGKLNLQSTLEEALETLAQILSAKVEKEGDTFLIN